MASFSGRISNRVIHIRIFLAHPIDSEDDSRWRPLTAKVDTDANVSCITSSVAQALDLTPSGYRPAQTPGGPINTLTFPVGIALVIRRGTSSNQQDEELSWLSRLVTASRIHSDSNTSFDVLLGMDFLEHCHLSMFGHTFILSN